MTYANQREHELLDRQTIKETLLALTRCNVQASPVVATFSEHLQTLKQQAGSGLEREWLDYLARRGLHLPTAAQMFIARVGTRPDFFYEKHKAAIYVDGPPHDFPDRQQRDHESRPRWKMPASSSSGSATTTNWDAIIAEHPNLFGKPQSVQTGTLAETGTQPA